MALTLGRGRSGTAPPPSIRPLTTLLTLNVPRLRPRPSNRVRMAKRRDPSGNPLVGLRLLGLARRGHLRGDGRRLPLVQVLLEGSRQQLIDTDPVLGTDQHAFGQRAPVDKDLLPHE